MSETYDDDEIIDVFIQESQEHLESIEPALISLEEEGADTDQETINLIFRAIHSIKGSAGFFGFNNISGLSHIMENMMVMVRDGTLVPSQEVVEALLKGLDKISVMIADVSNSEEVDVTEETNGIEAILSGDGGSGGNTKVATGKSLSGEEKSEGSVEGFASFKWDLKEFKDRLETGKKRGQSIFTLKKVVGNNEELLAYKENLESVGTIYTTNPEIFTNNGVNPDALAEGSGFYVLFSTILEPDMLIDFLGIAKGDLKEFDLNLDELIATEAPLPGKQEKIDKKVKKPAGAGEKPRGSSDTIRIRVELLDQVMVLAGEIVLGRNRLLMQFADVSDTTVISTHSQRVTELQEIIMKMRLQPVGTVFAKFRRIVRDMAVKVGKDINLVLEGEEVELDRSIIDGLTDPLTHIIRNSADHGLESAEERLFNGKPQAAAPLP